MEKTPRGLDGGISGVTLKASPSIQSFTDCNEHLSNLKLLDGVRHKVK